MATPPSSSVAPAAPAGQQSSPALDRLKASLQHEAEAIAQARRLRAEAKAAQSSLAAVVERHLALRIARQTARTWPVVEAAHRGAPEVPEKG